MMSAAARHLVCWAPTPDHSCLQVGSYHDRPQLVGKAGYGGRGFAFCLFDAAAPVAAPGGASALSAPYQSSHRHFHYDAREEALLGALRHYMATLSAAQLGGNTSYLRRIKDVRPQQFFDVVAQVVAADDSHHDLRLLHIWDGSDALPFPAT